MTQQEPMLFEQFNEAINLLSDEERKEVVEQFIEVEEKLKEASILHSSIIKYLKNRLATAKKGGDNGTNQ